jgi:hypothetical protein
MTTKTYARVASGIVMELFETEGDIATMFDPSLTWIECDAEGCVVGWSYANGTFSPPAAPSEAALWAAYQAQSMAALAVSDTTILRCYENGVAVPAAWADYRKALRAIVGASSGDPTQPLPSKPQYPSGT